MDIETPRLLLVEENELLADITAFRLELLGYSVLTMQSGEAAFQTAKHHPPNLIILDLVLSDMDGFELINRLSSDMETSEIPILVFSVDASLDCVERCFHSGANEYLVTPYDPAVLEEKVERLLQQATAP